MAFRARLLTLSILAAGLAPLPAAAEELKTTINPPHLMDTTRYGYSQATVVAPGARLIFLAGQVGTTDEGPNDFESQVDRAFDNLIAVLEASGGRVEDVVKITLLVKGHDRERLAYLQRKRKEVFGGHLPASTLIPVPALAVENLEFEIDAIAVAPAAD